MIEAFRAYLREHNLPVTPQRLAIADVVLSPDRHRSADEIAQELKARGVAVGTATVYRTLEVLVRQNKFKLPFVVDLMTRKPAQLLGLEGGTLAVGAPGDVCLFDPEESWRYDAKAGFSKSSNSPWNGQTLTGRVKATIVGGRVVFDGRKIHGAAT